MRSGQQDKGTSTLWKTKSTVKEVAGKLRGNRMVEVDSAGM